MTMKKTAALILSLIMMISCIPFTAGAAEIVDSGKCGENVTYTLDSDGLLTISGTGDMYFDDFSPWHGSVIKVSIENGVTSICDNAFIGSTKLSNITIPDSVSSIGEDAFSHCYELTSITFPKGISEISDGMFSDCFNLSNIVIPDGVTRVGDVAFSHCTQLGSIVIPKSVKSIGEGAFFECNDFTVYYTGSRANWLGINIEWPSGELLNAKKVFNYVCPHENTAIVNVKSATCTEDGYTGDTVCSVCGETVAKGTVITAPGHKTELQGFIKAVGTAEGYSGDKVCTVCGEVIEKGSVIPAPVKEITDSETGIEISYGIDVFNGEVGLVVEKKTDGNNFEMLGESDVNFVLFDISVESDGKKVQPEGMVTVSVPLPEGFDEKTTNVYYISDDGTCEKLKSSVKDGRVFFETTHFSNYAVVDGKIKNSSVRGDVNGDGKFTTNDVKAVLRQVAGLISLDDAQQKVADFNGDGRITTNDAKKMLRTIAGLE